MADVDIKRGYEVLPDNSVRFGIKIINNSNAAIMDVEVILTYPDSLFKLQDNRIQKLGNIPPNSQRTAKFILKPLGCVHKEHIRATVQYKDHKYEDHIISMQPKEIHCVCPFLRAMSINTGRFLELSSMGHSAEAGLNFEGISVDQVLSFLMQTCTNRLYKVEERSVDDGKILYLSSESIGEKAYYLLTVLIKGNEGHTQVMMRAVSDKTHGLQGFLNEIVSELKHLVRTVKSAREIGVIRHEQVINIIDSVVQRSNFSMDGSSGSLNVQDSVVLRSEIESSAASVNIQDSLVQHSTIKVDDRKKEKEELAHRELEELEELERRRREENEKKAAEEAEKKRKAEEERRRREEAEKKQQKEEKVRREKEDAVRNRLEKEKLLMVQLSKEQHPKKPASGQVKQPPNKRKSGMKMLRMAVILIVMLAGYWLMADNSDNQDIIIPEYEVVDSSAASSAQKTNANTVQKTEVLQLPLKFYVDIGGGYGLTLKETDLEGNRVWIECLNNGEFFADQLLGFENPNPDPYWQLVANNITMITLLEINVDRSCDVKITREVEVSAGDKTAASTVTQDSLETYTNSIGMEFVKIPAGSFYMGSNERDNEKPVHNVKISKSFFLGKYLVTHKQWVEVMGNTPSYFYGDNRPVGGVSWNDVQEFIKKLNEMEGTDKYRLPSEAEWEYACRAGTTTSYSFGDHVSDLDDYAWWDGNSGGATHPVGQKKMNPWGLYDMHGNVWEWCQDRSHANYDGAPADGSAWEDGSSSFRVLRGGGWLYDAELCRSANRNSAPPTTGGNNIGFRLLREM